MTETTPMKTYMRLNLKESRNINYRTTSTRETPGNHKSRLYQEAKRASTRKARASEQRRVEIEKVKLNIARRERRDRKYEPEMLFEFGFDENAKRHLESLIPAFCEQIKSTTLNVHHRLEPGFTDVFNTVFAYLRKMGKAVLKFALGIFKMFVYLWSPVYSAFADLFSTAEDEFFDASETLYEAEMGLSWDMFFSALHAKHFYEVLSMENWKMFVTSLAEIKKDTSSLSGTATYVTKLLKELVQMVCDAWSINNPFNPEDPLLVSIRTRCNNLMDELRTGQSTEYDFAQKVFVLQDEIETVVYSKRQNVDPKVKEALLYILRKFQPVVTYCERNVNPSNGPRIEPLSILIAGPTGVGKSTITIPFLLALMPTMIDREKKDDFMKNHNDFLFFRANENEFWDGYKMRNVAIVYDDFGQQRDLAGSPNPDAWEIIRLKNTAPYHLHFASIEDKQRNFAQPKLIFATSNLRKLHFDSLNCSEAVARRFDLSYIQVPKQEFSTVANCSPWERRLDLEKVRARCPYDPENPMSYADLDAIEFIPWDFIEGRQTHDKPLSFNELLKLAKEKHIQLSTRGDCMLKFHQKMKEYEPEMGAGSSIERDPSFTREDIYKIPGKLDEVRESISARSGNAFTLLKDAVGAIASKAKFAYKYVDENVLPKSGDARTSIVNILLVAAGIATSFGLLDRFIRSPSDPESNYSKSEGRSGKSRLGKASKANLARKSKLKLQLSPEAGNVNLDLYVKALKRNMYRFRVAGNHLGWATFLVGTTFIIPRHFEAFIDHAFGVDDVRKVEFVCPFSGITKFVLDYDLDMDLYDFHEDAPDRPDYIFLKVKDYKIRNHSSIVKFFPSEGLFKKGDACLAQFACVRSDSIVFQYPTVTYGDSVPYTWQGETFRSKAITYSTSSLKGDCGAPLITTDSRFPYPVILGFHTSGAPSGFSGMKNCAGVYVSIEEISSAIEACMEDHFEEDFGVQFEVEASVEGFNALSHIKQPRLPIESKIIHSELQPHLWELTGKPAKLCVFIDKNNIIIDPRKVARANYSHHEVYIESSVMDFIYPDVCSLILRKSQSAPWWPRLFTYEEAVQGIKGVEFCEGVNRSTSPGYPFVLNSKGRGKSEWFGSADEFDFSTPRALELKKEVLDTISKMEQGVRSLHVFVDYLKDERRPFEKVEQGKTRQFMACGLVQLIITKMYFGDFIRHVCQNRIHNGIAIGINPFAEWDDLARYLKAQPGCKFTAGDFSKYDARLPVAIELAALRVIEQFYYDATEEEKKVRRILFHEIINSMHVSEGILYEFQGSNPSGNPMTAVLNSVCNLFILSYSCAQSLKVAVGDKDEYEMDDFHEIFQRTRFQVFGDDNIVAYHPEDERFWNQLVLQERLPLDVGMTYTNETKGSAQLSCRNIEDISFLKRGFRPSDNGYVAPLELSVLKETLSWKKKNTTVSELKMRVDCVLSEFARHGQQVYDAHAPRIVDAARIELQYVPQNSCFTNAQASLDMLSI